jgi:hypothetical protein
MKSRDGQRTCFSDTAAPQFSMLLTLPKRASKGILFSAICSALRFYTAKVESRCDAVALGSNISVAAPFVRRCLTGSTVAPFSHPAHRTGQADFPHPACMGLSLSRRHHAISVVLRHSILLFDLRRKHSFVPTAHLHRRRAQRRSRTALLQRRRRLVLDGREHGGRLLAIG